MFIVIWATIFFGGFAMAILPPIFGTKIGPNRYHWLGMDFDMTPRRSRGGGWSRRLVGRRMVIRRRRLVVGQQRRRLFGRRRLVRRRRGIGKLVMTKTLSEPGSRAHRRGHPRCGSRNGWRDLLRRRALQRQLFLSRRLLRLARHAGCSACVVAYALEYWWLSVRLPVFVDRRRRWRFVAAWAVLLLRARLA